MFLHSYRSTFTVILTFIGSVIIFTSCAVIPPKYSVPKTVIITHAEVMNNDYPTKKTVFSNFGTPTSKETYDGIENWYFKISEVTNSKTTGLSTGIGRIAQNPLNPILKPVDRSLVTQQQQIINTNTNSVTKETYVKFWFRNDSVIKWETYGVNYEKTFVNPSYDENLAIQNEKMRKQAIEKNKPIVLGSIVGAFVLFILLPGSLL